MDLLEKLKLEFPDSKVREKFLLDMLKGNVPERYRDSNWRNGRRAILKKYIDELSSLDENQHSNDEYCKLLDYYQCLKNHLVALLKNPPAWIGIANNSLYTAESEDELYEKLDNCDRPYFIMELG